MPDDKKISGLTEVLHNTVNAASAFVVAYGGANYFIKLSSIAKYVLGVVGGALRAIGTNDDGAIVIRSNAGNTQTFPKANLTEPLINHATESVVATSVEINRACVGATSSVQTQLNTLAGRASTIERDIVDIEADMAAQPLQYMFFRDVGASDSSITITAADILTEIFGLSTGRYIDHQKLTIQHYSQIGLAYTKVADTGSIIEAQTISGPITCLKEVTIPTTSGVEYHISITFSLLET